MSQQPPLKTDLCTNVNPQTLLVMPEIFNPLLSAGEFLVSETSKRDGVTGLERLFVGTLDEAKQRTLGC